jgi:hypothetical protein
MKRIKLKLKNLDEINKIIEKKVTKTIKSKNTSEGIAEIAVSQVKDRKISVKSRATLAIRRYLEKGNQTAEDYKRGIINFTFTGELLKDLKDSVKLKTGKDRASYTLQNTKRLHKKYKKPDGGPIKGKSVSMRQISTFLNDKGYKYLARDKFNKKTTTKMIKYLRGRILNRFK